MKSTSDPAMRSSEVGSVTRTAPSRGKVRSSSAFLSSSAKMYWKPEQPPPSTVIRNILSVPSLAFSALIRLAAEAVRTSAGSMGGVVGSEEFWVIWVIQGNLVWESSRGNANRLAHYITRYHVQLINFTKVIVVSS